eukprot:6476138-Prymnesium_polylepis.1
MGLVAARLDRRLDHATFGASHVAKGEGRAGRLLPLLPHRGAHHQHIHPGVLPDPLRLAVDESRDQSHPTRLVLAEGRHVHDAGWRRTRGAHVRRALPFLWLAGGYWISVYAMLLGDASKSVIFAYVRTVVMADMYLPFALVTNGCAAFVHACRVRCCGFRHRVDDDPPITSGTRLLDGSLGAVDVCVPDFEPPPALAR